MPSMGGKASHHELRYAGGTYSQLPHLANLLYRPLQTSGIFGCQQPQRVHLKEPDVHYLEDERKRVESDCVVKADVFGSATLTDQPPHPLLRSPTTCVKRKFTVDIRDNKQPRCTPSGGFTIAPMVRRA